MPVDEHLRRSLYEDLRATAPELFANPPGAHQQILVDPAEVAAAEREHAERLAGWGMPAFMAETGVTHADPHLMVLRDAVRTPDGRAAGYTRVVAAGNAAGVVVLPRRGDDVLLVRHFRHSIRGWQLELPRGFGNPGSDPAGDARRELGEELGVEAVALHDLGLLYPDTGVLATAVRLFYATVSADARPVGEAGEGIDEVRAVSPAELAAMIRDETITDGFTIAAWSRAVLRGLLPAA
jgi:ADP-ribose pyrophosphatase